MRTKRKSEEVPADAVPKLGAVLDFMRYLWAVDHAIQTNSKRMSSQMGITAPQRLVVRIIGRSPGISAGAIARILHVHPSTLTGVLRRLEGMHAIKRTVDPTDGRRALFSLGERGRALDAIRSGTLEASVRQALARLRPSDIEATRRVLQTLTEVIHAENRRAGGRRERPVARR